MGVFKNLKDHDLAQNTFPTHKKLLCRVRDDCQNRYNSVQWNKVISYKGFDDFIVYIHDDYISINPAHSVELGMPITIQLDFKAWLELYLVLELVKVIE